MHTGRGVGFRLVDGTEEQLANLVAIWAPVEEWRLEVYFEADEKSPFGKAWRKWNTKSKNTNSCKISSHFFIFSKILSAFDVF
jgi:hypothetical protein